MSTRKRSRRSMQDDFYGSRPETPSELKSPRSTGSLEGEEGSDACFDTEVSRTVHVACREDFNHGAVNSGTSDVYTRSCSRQSLNPAKLLKLSKARNAAPLQASSAGMSAGAAASSEATLAAVPCINQEATAQPERHAHAAEQLFRRRSRTDIWEAANAIDEVPEVPEELNAVSSWRQAQSSSSDPAASLLQAVCVDKAHNSSNAPLSVAQPRITRRLLSKVAHTAAGGQPFIKNDLEEAVMGPRSNMRRRSSRNSTSVAGQSQIALEECLPAAPANVASAVISTKARRGGKAVAASSKGAAVSGAGRAAPPFSLSVSCGPAMQSSRAKSVLLIEGTGLASGRSTELSKEGVSSIETAANAVITDVKLKPRSQSAVETTRRRGAQSKRGRKSDQAIKGKSSQVKGSKAKAALRATDSRCFSTNECGETLPDGKHSEHFVCGARPLRGLEGHFSGKQHLDYALSDAKPRRAADAKKSATTPPRPVAVEDVCEHFNCCGTSDKESAAALVNQGGPTLLQRVAGNKGRRDAACPSSLAAAADLPVLSLGTLWYDCSPGTAAVEQDDYTYSSCISSKALNCSKVGECIEVGKSQSRRNSESSSKIAAGTTGREQAPSIVPSLQQPFSSSTLKGHRQSSGEESSSSNNLFVSSSLSGAPLIPQKLYCATIADPQRACNHSNKIENCRNTDAADNHVEYHNPRCLSVCENSHNGSRNDSDETNNFIILEERINVDHRAYGCGEISTQASMNSNNSGSRCVICKSCHNSSVINTNENLRSPVGADGSCRVDQSGSESNKGNERSLLCGGRCSMSSHPHAEVDVSQNESCHHSLYCIGVVNACCGRGRGACSSKGGKAGDATHAAISAAADKSRGGRNRSQSATKKQGLEPSVMQQCQPERRRSSLLFPAPIALESVLTMTRLPHPLKGVKAAAGKSVLSLTEGSRSREDIKQTTLMSGADVLVSPVSKHGGGDTGEMGSCKYYQPFVDIEAFCQRQHQDISSGDDSHRQVIPGCKAQSKSLFKEGAKQSSSSIQADQQGLKQQHATANTTGITTTVVPNEELISAKGSWDNASKDRQRDVFSQAKRRGGGRRRASSVGENAAALKPSSNAASKSRACEAVEVEGATSENKSEALTQSGKNERNTNSFCAKDRCPVEHSAQEGRSSGVENKAVKSCSAGDAAFTSRIYHCTSSGAKSSAEVAISAADGQKRQQGGDFCRVSSPEGADSKGDVESQNDDFVNKCSRLDGNVASEVAESTSPLILLSNSSSNCSRGVGLACNVMKKTTSSLANSREARTGSADGSRGALGAPLRADALPSSLTARQRHKGHQSNKTESLEKKARPNRSVGESVDALGSNHGNRQCQILSEETATDYAVEASGNSVECILLGASEGKGSCGLTSGIYRRSTSHSAKRRVDAGHTKVQTKETQFKQLQQVEQLTSREITAEGEEEEDDVIRPSKCFPTDAAVAAAMLGSKDSGENAGDDINIPFPSSLLETSRRKLWPKLERELCPVDAELFFQYKLRSYYIGSFLTVMAQQASELRASPAYVSPQPIVYRRRSSLPSLDHATSRRSQSCSSDEYSSGSITAADSNNARKGTTLTEGNCNDNETKNKSSEGTGVTPQDDDDANTPLSLMSPLVKVSRQPRPSCGDGRTVQSGVHPAAAKGASSVAAISGVQLGSATAGGREVVVASKNVSAADFNREVLKGQSETGPPDSLTTLQARMAIKDMGGSETAGVDGKSVMLLTPPSFMAGITPKARNCVTQWMTYAGRKLPEPLSCHTTYMAINLFDRYLSKLTEKATSAAVSSMVPFGEDEVSLSRHSNIDGYDSDNTNSTCRSSGGSSNGHGSSNGDDDRSRSDENEPHRTSNSSNRSGHRSGGRSLAVGPAGSGGRPRRRSCGGTRSYPSSSVNFETDAGAIAEAAAEDLRNASNELEVVGGACLFIASKMEDSWPLNLGDLTLLFDDGSQSRSSVVLKWEAKILRELGFAVNSPTVLTFIKEYMHRCKQDLFRPLPQSAPPSLSNCIPQSRKGAKDLSHGISSGPPPLRSNIDKNDLMESNFANNSCSNSSADVNSVPIHEQGLEWRPSPLCELSAFIDKSNVYESCAVYIAEVLLMHHLSIGIPVHLLAAAALLAAITYISQKPRKVSNLPPSVLTMLGKDRSGLRRAASIVCCVFEEHMALRKSAARRVSQPQRASLVMDDADGEAVVRGSDVSIKAVTLLADFAGDVDAKHKDACSFLFYTYRKWLSVNEH